MAPPAPLVLASASPRRARILDMLGLDFEVRPADVPEVARADESPEAYASRLAREKAEAVRGPLVIAADTLVVLDDRMLEKPADAAEARSMLSILSGRTHEVLTAVAVRAEDGGLGSTLERAEVRFRELSSGTIEAYVSTGEPLDKAGAYGLQGLGAAMVAEVRGDYYTVVGLPVVPLLGLLERLGWRYRFGSRLEPLADPRPGPPPERP